ncbi:hypothetical protein ON010_g8015 [Phytophthora cinnamomi]|nr:hypothetical protein ON010_g8015 [Phytophthora cinnamomi]
MTDVQQLRNERVAKLSQNSKALERSLPSRNSKSLPRSAEAASAALGAPEEKNAACARDRGPQGVADSTQVRTRGQPGSEGGDISAGGRSLARRRPRRRVGGTARGGDSHGCREKGGLAGGGPRGEYNGRDTVADGRYLGVQTILDRSSNALPTAAVGAVCDIDVGYAKPVAQRVRKVAPQFTGEAFKSYKEPAGG